MPSQTHNLKDCHDYEAAEKLFRSPSLRGKSWAPSERPLGSNRQYHYRVQRHEGLTGKERFSVWLYDTRLAEFHMPTPEGRRVVYKWDRRMTSTSFMSYVCHVGRVLHLEATDGTTRKVPLYAGGADLWFDANGKLDVSRSDHVQLYTYGLSADAKQHRKEFRAAYATYATLAAVRHAGKAGSLDDVISRMGISSWRVHRLFGAFSGPLISFTDRVRVREWLCSDDVWSERAELGVAALLSMAEDIVLHAEGKALYEQRPLPTVASLEKSIMRYMLTLRGLDERIARNPQPKFCLV